MKIKYAAAFFMAVISFSACADNNEKSAEENLAALCKQTLCRTPDFQLTLPSGEIFKHQQAIALPILQREMISIYPGEEIFIEAALDNDTLVLQRAVTANAHPAQTLVFKFSQAPGSSGMLLTVTNPFPADLKFRAGFMRPDSGTIYGTSTYPVPAGLSLFESWPFPMFQLILVEGHVLAKSDSRECK